MENPLKKLLYFIFFAALVVMIITTFAGCSVNQHLKKSKRQYEKAISKGYIPESDTVFITDTITISEIKTDTAFIDVIGDSVTITKDRLTIRYLRTSDSVYIEGECKADTIYREIPLIVQEKVYVTETLMQHLGIKKWWHKALLIFFVILVVVLVIAKAIK